MEALVATAARGTSYRVPCRHDIGLAQLVMEFLPNIEMIRFVNSCTEATMSALFSVHAGSGVYVALWQIEAGLISTAHRQDQIDATIAAARAFARLSALGPVKQYI